MMYIHEAAKLSGTTKKAIEYYCQKGLLNPVLSENGYRVFSDHDIDQLKKISLLRSLGVSVEDIRILLEKDDSTAFQKIIEDQKKDLQKRKEQNDLLKELAESLDWNAVELKAAARECRESVKGRLTKAFPGFWGKYLSLHFGQFLKDPVKTAEQEDAWRTVCDYLDSVQLEIPEDLENCLDEMNTEPSEDIFRKTNEALLNAVNDPHSWMKNNKEMIERYLELSQTDEWRNSPGAKLRELLTKFNQEQGYNTVFIPAMRKLSPAYDEYWQMLQKANEVFSRQYRQ